jgi:hypothetical protein
LFAPIIRLSGLNFMPISLDRNSTFEGFLSCSCFVRPYTKMSATMDLTRIKFSRTSSIFIEYMSCKLRIPKVNRSNGLLKIVRYDDSSVSFMDQFP